ncbi:unnamed protein product [Symbiodinium sp. CCMP2592]|nr:unnamed protein product [Symbiodinium sp. CCMP2592]
MVTKMTIVENEKSLKVQAGWYTAATMKDELGYDAKLDGACEKMIKKIVDYCGLNPTKLVRPWKYDTSLNQYWVETHWSGEITKKNIDRTTNERTEEADGTLPVVETTFDDQPPGPAAEEGGLAGAEDPRTMLDRGLAEVLSKVLRHRDLADQLAGELQSHAAALERHYDNMSMIKATASLRMLHTEIDMSIETASVLAVQAVSIENKVTPVLTELQKALKDKEKPGNEGQSQYVMCTTLSTDTDVTLFTNVLLHWKTAIEPGSKTVMSTSDDKSSVHWRYHKYMSAELLSLPDIAETWDGILQKRDLLKITLPDVKSVGKTPGKIFAHAEAMVEIVLQSVGCAVFKVGFTHDPVRRVEGYCDEGYHRFKEFGLALDVPISYVNVGDSNCDLPMIRPSDLFQHLADLGKLDLLFGQQPASVLPEFWSRFQEVEPNNTVHAAFAAGTMHPDRTIPMVIHGDEGRGRKRLPVMVVNTHGLIGAGCKAFHEFHKDAPRMQEQAMPVNIKGHSMETRFLSFVLSKKSYGTDCSYLMRMFEALVEDLCKLSTTGIQIKSKSGVETWHCAFIGSVGDLQFFAKVASLTRSYTHVSKRSGQQAKNGLCHLCLAGKPGWDYEDFSDNPAWLRSVGIEPPWESPPDLIFRLFHDPGNAGGFLKPDLWHCLHLGCGKVFLASALVEWLPFLPGLLPSKPWILAYLQRHGQKLYCRHVSELSVGFDSYQKCPQGAWQKASDTTLLLEIFEDFCEKHASMASEDAILGWTYTAVANLNACIRLLYKSGLWMTQHQALDASSTGMNFLKCYGHLVHLTFQANRDRFPITPKVHYIHHLFIDLKSQARASAWTLNCIAFTVQMDEDFVGVHARASRRAGAQYVSLRCLQRYLLYAGERITPEYRRTS